jgi:hypothetical protein
MNDLRPYLEERGRKFSTYFGTEFIHGQHLALLQHTRSSQAAVV